MSTSANLYDANTARRRLCLGIALGKREAGLALASREHLFLDRVLTLRKIPSVDGRERRFAQVVDKLIDDFDVQRVSLVLPHGRHAKEPQVQAQISCLERVREERGLSLNTYEMEEVKRSLIPTDKNMSLRELAEVLAEQFTELKSKAPSTTPVPGAEHLPELANRPRRTRTARERYWARMFLALGAAIYDLNRQIVHELHV